MGTPAAEEATPWTPTDADGPGEDGAGRAAGGGIVAAQTASSPEDASLQRPETAPPPPDAVEGANPHPSALSATLSGAPAPVTARVGDEPDRGPLAQTRSALWDTLNALEAETSEAWIRLGDDLFGLPPGPLTPPTAPQSEDEGETSGGGGGVAMELSRPDAAVPPPPAPERSTRSAPTAPLAPRRGAR